MDIRARREVLENLRHARPEGGDHLLEPANGKPYLTDGAYLRGALHLVKWGFTLADIEAMAYGYDHRLFPLTVREVVRLEAIDRLQRKLDTAEAFNHAYVGSQH